MAYCVTRNKRAKELWYEGGVRLLYEGTEIDTIYLQELDDFVEGL